jgi:hypothetical protein
MEENMLKSQEMTPEQRADVAGYLDNMVDEELSPDDWEVILDMIVDMGLAEKGEDGRYRLAQGIKIVTDEEYNGE